MPEKPTDMQIVRAWKYRSDIVEHVIENARLKLGRGDAQDFADWLIEAGMEASRCTCPTLDERVREIVVPLQVLRTLQSGKLADPSISKSLQFV
jgi:hypothetical protein